MVELTEFGWRDRSGGVGESKRRKSRFATAVYLSKGRGGEVYVAGGSIR